MSNLHYCIFRNTLEDLEDAYDTMIENPPLSEEERKAFERLVKLCKTIGEEFGDNEFFD